MKKIKYAILTTLTILLMAGCSNTNKKNTNTQKTSFVRKKYNGVVPENMLGEWYGFDNRTQKIVTIQFTKSSMNNGKTTSEIHTKQDISKDDGKEPIQKKKAMWVLSTNTKIKNENWMTLRSWYQTDAPAYSYRVINRKIDEKSTPVLTVMYTNSNYLGMHYYKSEELAEKMKDTLYKGEKYTV